MKKNSKQRLLEVMQRVDPSFKPKLNEEVSPEIQKKVANLIGDIETNYETRNSQTITDALYFDYGLKGQVEYNELLNHVRQLQQKEKDAAMQNGDYIQAGRNVNGPEDTGTGDRPNFNQHGEYMGMYETNLNEGEGTTIDIKLDFPKNTSSINAEGRDVATNFPLTEEGLYNALYKIYADVNKRYYNLIEVAYVNPRGRSGQYEMDIMLPDRQNQDYVAKDMKDNITELFIEINKDDREPPPGGVPAPGAEKQNFRENEDTMYSPKDSYDKNKSYTIADGPFTKKYPQYKGKEVKVIGGLYDGPDSVTVQTLDGTSFTLSPNEIVDSNKQGAVMRENGMYESKEKFKFGKSSKKRLFEVMQRVAPNFKGKALNEGGWNLPDNVRSDDPHFNPDPEDDYSTWGFEKDRRGNYMVVLYSEHNGEHSVEWDYLLEDSEEYDIIQNQIKTNPKDPELIKRIDVLVDEFLRSNMGQSFEWTYQEPDGEPYDY